MQLLLLSLVLTVLYASDTILIAYNYRFLEHNPSSAKLILIAELLKLLITALFLGEQHKGAQQLKRTDEFGGCLPRNGAGSIIRKWWTSLPAWVRDLVTFSVPAMCYFLTNNLSFYALQLMSAHLYTLLGDLRVITTGLLNYLVLDKTLNRQALLSLCMLFCGISIGQVSTIDTPADDTHSTSTHHWATGVALMLLICSLSAVASVYQEWVMAHAPRYKHESIHLQNMRLYVVGVVLNGVWYLQSGGASQPFLADMGPSHWVVALILACMGLVTAVLIKRFGTIIKVYASSVASLFAAAVSQWLLHDPPPPLFYLGVVLAMVATLQLQRARSQDANATATATRQPSHKPGSGPQFWFRAVAVVPVVAAALTLVLLLSPATSNRLLARQGFSITASTPGSQSVDWLTAAGVPKPAQQHTELLQTFGRVTDAPMPVLPPFEPTCFVIHEQRVKVQCPVVNCSLDSSCTTRNKSCCAFINLQMMLFFDQFLYSKGLEGQYMLVYGSALGAHRNNTVLAHTSDVDFAFTPKAAQVLEQNATRRELWQHGYSFWADETVWRMCPHQHHPSPDFQQLMLPLDAMNHDQQSALTGAYAGTCWLDVFLMWPVPQHTRNCSHQDPDLDLESILGPAVGSSMLQIHTSPRALGPSSPSDAAQQALGSSATAGRVAGQAQGGSTFCIHRSELPVVLKPLSRPARVDGYKLPAPEDLDGHVAATYGPGWRLPNYEFHVVGPDTPDVDRTRLALHQRLSVTAWGNTAWTVRQQRCQRSG